MVWTGACWPRELGKRCARNFFLLLPPSFPARCIAVVLLRLRLRVSLPREVRARGDIARSLTPPLRNKLQWC